MEMYPVGYLTSSERTVGYPRESSSKTLAGVAVAVMVIQFPNQ